jgi:hypothetical protein
VIVALIFAFFILYDHFIVHIYHFAIIIIVIIIIVVAATVIGRFLVPILK